MAHRKVYTPEFKQQAVQLAQQPGNGCVALIGLG